MLDSNEQEITTPSTRLPASTMSRGSASLLALLPSREDMVVISEYSHSWLSWYKVLFSLNLAMGAGSKMLDNYDRIRHAEMRPVPIATILLAVTLTVQQAQDATNMLRSIPDANTYIKNVSNLVEKVVVSNDDLIADLDGIRCVLLFIRL
jgi:hypothetical protein